MDSICFYQPLRTMPAFSEKATRSHGLPVFMPTARDRQRTNWGGALEAVEVMEVVDLTGSEERGHILGRQPARDGSGGVQGVCSRY